MVSTAIATSTAMEKWKETEEHKFGCVWYFNEREIRLYFLFFYSGGQSSDQAHEILWL